MFGINMLMRVLMTGLILAILFANPSSADRRSYVWTYEYMTMPRGWAEMEVYTTLEQPSASDANTSTWKHWLEMEYGLTDHWDVALYQQFKQLNTPTASTFAYDGYKLRTRYRFGEKNQFIVDPLLYFEYIGKNDLSQSSQGEAKLILARDFSRLNLAYNQIYKWDLNGRSSGNEYSAGINLRLNPALVVGLESKGNYTAEEFYLGPTLALTTQKFWTALGIVKGLNPRSDNAQVRMIMGILL
ncbi:MAG: hypothetical protein PHG97_04315 [Candidatus Margulisbacteria bacterium]|nr:hypothetical protein [Candidatus Margulisiibacteriota bacterium]